MTKLKVGTPQAPRKRGMDENAPKSEPVMKKSKLSPSGDDGGGTPKFVKGGANRDSHQSSGFRGRGGRGGGYRGRGRGGHSGRAGGRFAGEKGCFNCGEEGHQSKECKQPRKEGTRAIRGNCFNCGEAGHISRDCSQPKKEQQSGVKRPAAHRKGSTQPKKAKMEKWKKSKPQAAIKRKPTASQIKATEAQQKFIKLFDEKEKCVLFVRGFPKDMLESDIKAWSKDIVAVRLTQFADRRLSYAHLEFASEELADKNLDILKQKKFGDKNLTVAYTGIKFNIVHPQCGPRNTYADGADLDPKRLHVTQLKADAKIEDVKSKFPKAEEIWIRNGQNSSHALVFFGSVEDAIEGLDVNKKFDIKTVFGKMFYDDNNKPLPRRSQLGSRKFHYTVKTYKEEAPEEGDSETGSVEDEDKSDAEEDGDEGTITVLTKMAANNAVDSKKATKKKSVVKKFESQEVMSSKKCISKKAAMNNVHANKKVLRMSQKKDDKEHDEGDNDEEDEVDDADEVPELLAAKDKLRGQNFDKMKSNIAVCDDDDNEDDMDDDEDDMDDDEDDMDDDDKEEDGDMDDDEDDMDDDDKEEDGDMDDDEDDDDEN